MPCDPGLLDSYTKDIDALVESFSEKDPAGKQSLLQLLTSDPQAFCAASIRMLANAKGSVGARFVTYLLTKEKLLTPGLLDPDTCSLKDAMAAARTIEAMGTRIQPALEMALSKALRNRAMPESTRDVLRILDLLGAIAAQNCWPEFQTELMSHPDTAVRSKAALLIGRNTRNTAWISRRLLDKDARVQANAVEALWALDGAEGRPLLMTALRSQHNRVAANAALGLYRLSDLKVVRALLDMAQHSNPLFRISALWAIGETEDPRFIPFLMEQFKSSQGRAKLAVTRALSRIRRHEKANAAKGPIQIVVSGAKIKPDGGRHLELALARPDGHEVTSIKPTEFAVWEGGVLIEDYEVKLPNNPAVLVIGVVAPRFTSNSDPYGKVVGDCLHRCLPLKRPDDWWRIDRYAIETVADELDGLIEKSALPYDDVLINQELKTRKGFIADMVQLEKAISLLVPRERATTDAVEAIQRQIDAMDKSSGKRHLFVFVHAASTDALDDPDNLKGLKALAAKESITFHAICPDSSGNSAGFRDLCLSSPDGTCHTSSLDTLADEFEQIYRNLLNRYEINYSLSAKAERAPVTLQVCCDYGVGRAEFELPAPP